MNSVFLQDTKDKLFMRFNNLIMLSSVALMTLVFSCKTEEKKESSEPAPVLTNNDASNARVLELAFPLKDTTFIIDTGNTGGGQVQEFSTDSAALRHMFAREDNTEWYKFTASGDTGLSISLRPKDPANQLDFVLFRANDGFAADLAAGKLNALRSNFNRDTVDGKKGLACDPRLSYHGAGGSPMSRAFTTRKDQAYYLVVNSAAGKSSGYELKFHACSPGEGGLGDFEGNSQNPETETTGSNGSAEGNQANPYGSGGMNQSAQSGNTSGTSSGNNWYNKGSNSKDPASNSGSTGYNATKGNGNQAKAGKESSIGTTDNSSSEKSAEASKKWSGKAQQSRYEKSIPYTVSDQETLYSIAFKMGMTVEELMELNGLTDTNIFPGQALKVKARNLSLKEIRELVAKSKKINPSAPKPGSTTDPKEIARVKAEKAAAEEARKKAIAEELKAKNAASKQTDNRQSGDAGTLKPKNPETLSGRNPNFNPTPNFPVNNPQVTKGVETSNALAPADKSFYVYCNVTSGVNRNPVGGVLQVVDLKKKDLVYNVQANKTQSVPLFNAGGKQKLLICDIFGYKKQDFDLNLDNIINDSTAQQVQLVDDTIVINFELRRLEKGDVAVAYNIFFYDDASVMLPKSTYELDQLLELMQENKKIRVKIHGHTNTSKLGKILYLDKGDRNFFRFTAKNKETFGPAKMLSKKRAETIKMYLESKKITEDRIETEGHGGSQMLYPNTHPLAFKNKRVEVEILEDK